MGSAGGRTLEFECEVRWLDEAVMGGAGGRRLEVEGE
ncbi:hypothetical protein CCACVL1_29809, partial [Corchorus capsularis]